MWSLGPWEGTENWWTSPGSTAHEERKMGLNRSEHTGNLARNLSWGGRINPERHMYVNEQRFQKQVLPNVEHLCELVNGNSDLKPKAVFMDF